MRTWCYKGLRLMLWSRGLVKTRDQRQCRIIYSKHKPYLNHPDYFFGRYLKERVYQVNPDVIDRLKQTITRAIWRIPRDMLERFVNSFNVP